MSNYNEEAVAKAIASHNRRPRGGRIGGREAQMIHALLKGHGKCPTTNTSK